MTEIPPTNLNVQAILPGAQFADCFTLTVNGQSLDAASAAERVMGRTPRWVTRLMTLRDIAVWPLRLKTRFDPALQTDDRIGIFPLVARLPAGVVLGLDDRHLDFRLLVEVENLDAGAQKVTASTFVKTHNLLGRAYLAAIMPFHRIIVPAMLSQLAAK